MSNLFDALKQQNQIHWDAYLQHPLSDTHKAGIDAINVNVLSHQRLEQLSTNFGAATRLEVGFWQMGIEIS